MSDGDDPLTKAITQLADLKDTVAVLRTDVDGLKRFQAWVFGIGTGVGALAAILGKGIKAWLIQ